jgi:hypothetical protein
MADEKPTDAELLEFLRLNSYIRVKEPQDRTFTDSLDEFRDRLTRLMKMPEQDRDAEATRWNLQKLAEKGIA